MVATGSRTSAVRLFAAWLTAALVISIVVAGAAVAQAPAAREDAKPAGSERTKTKWRNPGKSAAQSAARPKPADDGPSDSLPADGPGDARSRRPLARVNQGPATLPNEHGQVWREYDIGRYTLRATATERPEQAVIDWILRETGYEAWHSEPLAILSATARTLTVYHTPQMQSIVSELVDRFVDTQAETHAFSLRVATVGSPNWRARAQGVLHPVPVQSQGIQAWLVQKEDAALLVAELRKRLDYREHSSPHLLVNNGQAATVSATRPRAYTRDVILRPEAWPGFEAELAQFEEGFSLEFSPLLAIDGQTVDAVIKCNIDQLEKLVPVTLDVPNPVAPRQRTKVEVPQSSQCRLHERFRWPVDQVLVVGLGVVATPTPDEQGGLLDALPLPSGPARADLLVFIESKGKVTPPAAAAAGARDNYRGRY